MKGIFIILDGVADLPVQALGQKTPLEAAKTPNLDALARKSKIDYCHTVGENIAPQSSNAVISLFGKDPNEAPRGSLEAQGAGIGLTNGDLALRTNFATIDSIETRNIIDRRAGRTLSTKEALALAKAVNRYVKLPNNIKFEFKPTVHHRGVLVFRGGFSENITNLDPSYGRGVVNLKTDNKIHLSKPMDDEEDSKFAADLVNTFVRKSFEILDKHPVNIKRAKKGLHAANAILGRDSGNHPVKFKKLPGKWAACVYMPLEIGIAKSLQMDILKFKAPGMKSPDIYANLYTTIKGFTKHAVKMIKKNKNKYDYFYIHIKKTDTPGHDNKPLEKIKMIEILDQRLFGFLKDTLKKEKLLITADHTTACKYKAHTADPVPVLTYPIDGKEKDQRFTETDAKKGRKILGRKLLEQNFF